MIGRYMHLIGISDAEARITQVWSMWEDPSAQYAHDRGVNPQKYPSFGI
ncbi:MAG: hypothetical protein IPF95_18605 [Flavobacteriales bacterium]|nr:hypothetical protein [Flavobacteriales bacterium]